MEKGSALQRPLEEVTHQGWDVIVAGAALKHAL